MNVDLLNKTKNDKETEEEDKIITMNKILKNKFLLRSKCLQRFYPVSPGYMWSQRVLSMSTVLTYHIIVWSLTVTILYKYIKIQQNSVTV